MSVSLDEVSERWPLIRYLLDDAVYRAEYVRYVEKFISEVYIPETLISRFENLHDLIAPYVVGSSGVSSDYSKLPVATAFENSIAELASHTIDQYEEATSFVVSSN